MTGHKPGYGVKEGYERVVFKSFHGKYMAITKFKNVFAKERVPKDINKLIPTPLGKTGKVVTLKRIVEGYNRFIKCDFLGGVDAKLWDK